MRLRSRLVLAQAPLWIALALVGAIAVVAVERLGAESQQILQDNYRSVLAAERMKESLERMDSGAMFAFSGHPDEGTSLERENAAIFERELALQEGNITERGETAKTRALRSEWESYRAQWQKFGDLEDPVARRAFYFATLQPAFAHARDAADEILALNQDAMIQKSDRAHRDAERIVTLLILGAVGAMIAGAWSASALTTRLLRPVSVLTQTVQRIGAGDLAVRAEVRGSDEIAQLAREFNSLVESVAAYRQSTLGDLIQAQQSAQAAIDSLPDPVIVFGSGGSILSLNRVAETVLGISSESAEPLAKTAAVVREAIEKARSWVVGGKGHYIPHGYDEAIRIEAPDGEGWFLVRASPIYTDVGISGVTVLLQDVTRLRRFDELTRDLVATVAHEFRTPLTSLQMAVHLCLEQLAGPITEKQADLLQAAREDTDRLMDLVEDLLDVSRLQAGRAQLVRTEIDAETIVREVVAAHAAAAEARRVRVGVEIAPDVLADADRERTRLVLANLISNAIRHAKESGSVVVRAREGGDFVRFEVYDDGPGIPPEWRSRIFEKFVRIPGSEAGGAGLGLHISREIVLAHGGEIGIDEDPSGGTRFWFTLPRSKRAEDQDVS